MRSGSLTLLAVLCMSLAAARSDATEGERVVVAGAGADKSGYHLFRPTPSSLLRDLSTDRPDLTESPFTVDAGHFQAEVEVVSFARDHASSARTETAGLLFINAKLGLLPSLDLQAGVGSARIETRGAADPGANGEWSGGTDLALRLKWNLWGNDAGRTAMALMPFVIVPTAAEGLGEGSVAGGLIVPFGLALSGSTNLGVMVEADWLNDQAESGHHVQWVTTATVGHDLFGPVGGFVEFAAGFRPRTEGDWIGTVDAGITYGPTPNVQVDGGVLLGVSDAADGVAVFLGFSLRR